MKKSTRRRSDTQTVVANANDTGAGGDREPALDHEQIAHRAFELFCDRGCQDGHDVDDWLQAERELQPSHGSAAQR